MLQDIIGFYNTYFGVCVLGLILLPGTLFLGHMLLHWAFYSPGDRIFPKIYNGIFNAGDERNPVGSVAATFFVATILWGLLVLLLFLIRLGIVYTILLYEQNRVFGLIILAPLSFISLCVLIRITRVSIRNSAKFFNHLKKQ